MNVWIASFNGINAKAIRNAEIIAAINDCNPLKPAGKKDLVKLLRLLEKSGHPHIVINSKGRVVFPDKRFHGAVIVTDFNKE